MLSLLIKSDPLKFLAVYSKFEDKSTETIVLTKLIDELSRSFLRNSTEACRIFSSVAVAVFFE